MTAQKGFERSVVCRQLVEGQGGTMTLKSEVAEGSAFTVQMQAREKSEVK
jgi:signal transduction histidine kinase